MGHNRKVSNSYEAVGVDFDPTDLASKPNGVPSPAPIDVQQAILDAMPNAADTTEYGIVQRATDQEALDRINTTKYITPSQIPPAPDVIFDENFDQIPVAIYGGQGTFEEMIATYDSSPPLPLGSTIIYDQRKLAVLGWGNGAVFYYKIIRTSMIKIDDNYGGSPQSTGLWIVNNDKI